MPLRTRKKSGPNPKPKPGPPKTTQIAKKRLQGMEAWLDKQINGNKVYPPAVLNKIVEYTCQEVVKGRTLANILADDNMPALETWYKIQRSSPSVMEALTQARELRQYIKVDSKQAILQGTKDLLLSGAHDKVANALSSLTKTQLDSIHWDAERFAPQQFSPKLQVQASVEHTVVHIHIERPVIDVSRPVIDVSKE